MMEKPDWLRKKINLKELNKLNKELKNLNTVCQSALCPNRTECFTKKTATIMILGKNCTRNCKFCNITSAKPEKVNKTEPAKVAEAIKKLNLAYAVITSVTRDDLRDGGASHFAKTITETKKKNSNTIVEVLVPDFEKNIETIVNANPNVISHNLETIPRLYKNVRPGANYKKSLNLLKKVKKFNQKIYTKSGLMLGLGETTQELTEVMLDLRKIKCDILTLGQYIPPSKKHYKLREYISPETFKKYKKMGYKLGFLHVESAPYVRSSYHTKNLLKKIRK